MKNISGRIAYLFLRINNMPKKNKQNQEENFKVIQDDLITLLAILGGSTNRKKIINFIKEYLIYK